MSFSLSLSVQPAKLLVGSVLGMREGQTRSGWGESDDVKGNSTKFLFMKMCLQVLTKMGFTIANTLDWMDITYELSALAFQTRPTWLLVWKLILILLKEFTEMYS